ncbi:MAG TPA: acyltransferase, partial [Gammaproteobacteria bacterium]|nr:acyltransferase [Gammaproteobacteria bacterium]
RRLQEQSQTAPLRLSHIHSFRAIAILLIVAGHSLDEFSWQAHPGQEALLLDLVENGTVLFVFIAGYLFEYLLPRYRYGEYLTKKFTNVILPYLIVSLPAMLHRFLMEDPARLYPQIQGMPVWYQVLWYYVKGGAHMNFPLWFIPMITVYYLLAPVFQQISRHPRWFYLLVLLVPLSVAIHRQESPNLNLLHSTVYFLSAYVAGMWACRYSKQIEPKLERHWLALGIGFVAMIAVHYVFAPKHGNYESVVPFSQENGPIDWMFLIKLYMCFALLGVLRRFDAFWAPKLAYLADISFAIFFVHAYFMLALSVLFKVHTVEGNFFVWSIDYVAIMAVTVAAIWLAKKVLGDNSRYVIGS